MQTFAFSFVIVSLSMLGLWLATRSGHHRSQSGGCDNEGRKACGNNACIGCARGLEETPGQDLEQDQ
jgi:hypothetical protein